MTNIAIKVENLWKQYRIGRSRLPYHTIRESIQGGIQKIFLRKNEEPFDTNYIMALQEVSFDITQGEVVGVIGRNGAGKSTLLKVLAHITQPTRGRVEIHGRVGSLLEVGTGFHNELTGRENIYLNGAILGMRRMEINRKFDEIVAFAEVEKFLDTPVKHYSTGMFMRLAFAVAAHLEPEILLVDEVLAVGDAQFQKKCLGKMGEVAKGGRTVFFVSHNMAAVDDLCQTGILLTNGCITRFGPIREVLNTYVESNQQSIYSTDLSNLPRRAEEGKKLKFIRAEIKNDLPLTKAKSLKLTIGYEGLQDTDFVFVGFEVHRLDGICVFSCDSEDDNKPIKIEKGKVGFSTVTVEHHNLSPGKYFLRLVARSGNQVLDWLDNMMDFSVASTGGSLWSGLSHLGMRPDSIWEVAKEK